MPLMHASQGKVEAFFLSTNNYEDIAVVDSLARTTTATILFLVHESLYNNPHCKCEIDNMPSNVMVETFSDFPLTPTTDRVISFTDDKGNLYLNFHDSFKNFVNFPTLLKKLRNGNHTVNYVEPESEYYIAGGDTIVGDGFIIFGPLTNRLQSQYWQTSSVSVYQQSFQSFYHYPKGALRFLNLNDQGSFLLGAALYHLDMFVSYLGKQNGYEQFVLGQIPREFLNNGSNKEELEVYQKYIDEVEEQLVGFFGEDKISIEYIPLIPGYDRDFGNFWGFHTHNNIVSQVLEQDSELLIPYYTDATYSEYDEAHAKTVEVFSNYFTKINQIKFSRTLLETYKSSLHCFAAPLARL